MSDRRCPDCNVAMETTRVTVEGLGDLYVETERDGGFLDRLGIGEHASVAAYGCPECGLVRLYAES